MERDFAGLAMHQPRSMDFPLIQPDQKSFDAQLDDRVFARHYKVLEGRRNLWEKLRDRLFPAKKGSGK